MNVTKVISKNVVLVKSTKNNHLFTCVLPDYVAHESSKEFWKITHFENMRGAFPAEVSNPTLMRNNFDLSLKY